MNTHKEMYDTWRLLYAQTWNKYQNPQYPEQSAVNLVVLMHQAEKYRASITAFNRALSEVKQDLMRLDGKTEADDVRDNAQRQAQRESDEEANTMVTPSDYEYIASLSVAQVSEAYHSNPEFARVHRACQRQYGFHPPAPRASVSR